MEPAVVFLFGDVEARVGREDVACLVEALRRRTGQDTLAARRLLETLEQVPAEGAVRAPLRDDELPELAWAIRTSECESLGALDAQLRSYFDAFDRGC